MFRELKSKRRSKVSKKSGKKQCKWLKIPKRTLTRWESKSPLQWITMVPTLTLTVKLQADIMEIKASHLVKFWLMKLLKAIALDYKIKSLKTITLRMILVSVFWVVDDLDYLTWQIIREINSLAKMQQEKQKTLTICQLANQRLKCNAKVVKDHLRTLCKLTINNKVWPAKNQGITKDLLMVAD